MPIAWRTYTADKPVNIFKPALQIKKGDRLALDTDYTPTLNRYYVIYHRGDKDDPLKFEVLHNTWSKLAENSTL